MASFFIRRRSLIFKAVIGIPVLWFMVVTLLAFRSKDPNETFQPNRHVDLERRGVADPGLNQRVVGDKPVDWLVPPHFNNGPDPRGNQRRIQDGEDQAKAGEAVVPVVPLEDKRVVMDRLPDRDNKVVEVLVEERKREGRQNIPLPRQQDVAKTTTEDPNAPGAMGKAVEIKKEDLVPDERRKFEDGWQNNAFNQYASDMISLHRSLPDVRDAECRDIKYADDLPDTSVIICFHNEAWSVLLRTVHSVIDRSPKHLIKEIILVDDFSNMDHLKEPLKNYIAKLKVVRVVRTKKREGLIRARLLGASVAQGNVLTYLDSHCECAQGWLEPLLDEIKKDKTTVVCPVIDVIADDNFKFQYGSARSTSVGGFDWNLQFNWHPIPDHEVKRRGNDFAPIRVQIRHLGWLEPLVDRIKVNKTIVVSPVIESIHDETLAFERTKAKRISVGGFRLSTMEFDWFPLPREEYLRRYKLGTYIDPIRSPTMAGGLFSISREYFEELGSYDPGMDIWGGENLELSFRIWMCGGTLEIIPCSHVGHIFRKRSPYSWKSGENVVKKNSVRLAEVWMDEYKKYYYERFNFDLGQYGDVSARKELRKRLKCKSFDWYIKNVFPDLFVPGDAVASGEVRSKASPMCLDSPADTPSFNKAVKMWQCHGQGGNQFWMLSKSGEIRRDEGCMDYTGRNSVNMFACHSQKGNQEWIYGPDNTLRHVNTNQCMEVSEDGQHLSMKACTGTDRQIWLWKRK